MPIGSGVGRVEYRFDMREEYVDFIEKCVPVDLKDMKIVVDCAEGASHYTSVKVLRDLGADVVAIHTSRMERISMLTAVRHIWKSCGQESFMKKADVGLAFDGDADRMLAVDECGEVVDGDQLMSICGNYMKQKGTLKKKIRS